MRRNPSVSVSASDPENIDRWFCIQGTIEAQAQGYKVNIEKLILFPRE